jgi:pilus assembly protein CpaC
MRNRDMATRLTRAALITALAAVACLGASFAQASDPPAMSGGAIQVVGSDSGSRFVQLGVGKSVVIDLPRDIKDVLVAEPKFANAVVRSTRRAYLIGVAVGQTNIYFFDAEGKQIAGFDVAVTRDLNGVRAMMQKMFPNGEVRVDGVGDGVMLTGTVASPVESQQAYDTVTRLVGSAEKVVNNLTIRGRDQVMLKVTVAEVARNVVKQLGVDVNGSLNYGSAVLNFNNSNPFAATGHPLVSGNSIAGSFKSVTATLNAMEQAGLVRTLAEPTLTAISGESASFLAGGEFPYPVPQGGSPPVITIQFKKFGVGLTFTPVVLSEGRISMRVMTEVSELSSDGSIVLQGFTVPSLKVRRADTTVEIPSGGSLAMAGMIQEQTKQQISGLPGLMQVPVLGTLFKSRDYVNNQTELMVIVTPYIARAVARKDLSRPDDGFADAGDPAAILLNRLNKIYGKPGQPPSPAAQQNYHGKYGFILD